MPNTPEPPENEDANSRAVRLENAVSAILRARGQDGALSAEERMLIHAAFLDGSGGDFIRTVTAVSVVIPFLIGWVVAGGGFSTEFGMLVGSMVPAAAVGAVVIGRRSEQGAAAVLRRRAAAERDD